MDPEYTILTIAGRTFHQYPKLNLRQTGWFIQTLKGYDLDLENLSSAQMMTILGEQVHRLAAILLHEDGISRTAKGQGGAVQLTALESWLADQATPEEIAPVLASFFVSGAVLQILGSLRVLLDQMTALTVTAAGSTPGSSS